MPDELSRIKRQQSAANFDSEVFKTLCWVAVTFVCGCALAIVSVRAGVL